jgi:hypothetical protein
VDAPWAQIRMLGQKKVIELILEVEPIPRPQRLEVQRRKLHDKLKALARGRHLRGASGGACLFHGKNPKPFFCASSSAFYLKEIGASSTIQSLYMKELIFPFTENDLMELLTT